MNIHLYHHRKIVAKALSQLLKSEGYQVFYNQEYEVLQSHIPFKGNTLLLMDLDSLSYLDPIQVLILCNIRQNAVLLGSLSQLNWYFKLSSKFKGFICKTEQTQLLNACIKKLQNQGSFLCGKTAKFLKQEKLMQQKTLFGASLNQSLTKTELKVILEIGNGKTSKQIARDWNRSHHTISNHRKNIKEKLNGHDSFQLSKFCFSRIDAIETLISLEKHKKSLEPFMKK
jgi:DNA-binding NarL/FixJ family response regulator